MDHLQDPEATPFDLVGLGFFLISFMLFQRRPSGQGSRRGGDRNRNGNRNGGGGSQKGNGKAGRPRKTGGGNRNSIANSNGGKSARLQVCML